MVTINIGRKEAIFFGAIILIFLVVGLAVAWESNNPEIMGHSLSELEKCEEGQTLVMKDGAWSCGDSAGAGTAPGSFGDWSTMATLATGGTETIVNDHIYRAQTDGFIMCKGTSSSVNIAGYSDSSNPPNTQRTVTSISPAAGELHSIMMPVKKGDYWKVTYCTDNIFWLPMGSS